MRGWLLALILLLTPILGACTLKSSEEESIATETATSEGIPSVTPADSGKPTVVIVSPQNNATVTVNEPIILTVTATDTVGITLMQLLVGGQVARSFSSLVPETTKNQLIDYTPRTEGVLTLQVVAYRGSLPSDPAQVTVNVQAASAQSTASVQPAYATSTLDPYDRTCRIQTNTVLNFRTGPGTGYSVIRQLTYGEILPIIGRLGDNTWLKLRDSGWREGWINADYVTIYGDCLNVPVVQSSATPTSTAPTPIYTNTPPLATYPATTVPPTAIPTAEPLPNLVVTNIDGLSTLTIPAGATTVTETYSVNITNRGGTLNQQFTVMATIIPTGTTFEVGVVGNLGPNQSVSLSAPITFNAPGTMILQFTADSNYEVIESNEVDNSGSKNVTVNQG